MGAGLIDSVNHRTYNFIFRKCDKIFYLKQFVFIKFYWIFVCKEYSFCVTGFWEIPGFVTRTSQIRRVGRPLLWSETKLRMELVNATVFFYFFFWWRAVTLRRNTISFGSIRPFLINCSLIWPVELIGSSEQANPKSLWTAWTMLWEEPI